MCMCACVCICKCVDSSRPRHCCVGPDGNNLSQQNTRANTRRALPPARLRTTHTHSQGGQGGGLPHAGSGIRVHMGYDNWWNKISQVRVPGVCRVCVYFRGCWGCWAVWEAATQ